MIRETCFHPCSRRLWDRQYRIRFHFIGMDAYLIFIYSYIMLLMAYKNVREEKLTTAFFISGSPIMAAIPAIIPCVMAGNAILVVGVGGVSLR